VALLVTRRQILRWGLVGGTLVALPVGLLGCGDDENVTSTPTPVPPTATPTPVPSFLTAEERQVVRAITARVVPTDDLPGAVDAGAHEYIDRLLSVVPDENEPAYVFAGGPFSNRNAFPDPATGTPSTRFPSDDFAQFIPLTRLQLMSWRVKVLGSAAVPGADFNAAVLKPVIGWREQYRSGIAAVEAKSTQMFAADFATLTPTQQDAVLKAADQTFVNLITGHILEGMFCPPEYGGNTNRVGWQLIGYDGDSQPLGYSIFNETTMTYNERDDKPNSKENPDEDFSGVDEITTQFLTLLVKVANIGTPYFPR
jgi:Gluconate 2-dehydrogenase subunit 3